jgi:hypothetical protein
MSACVRNFFVGWLILLSGLLTAQRLPATSLPSAPTLRQLVRDSGYIFSGTVMSVKPVAPAGSDAVTTMQISFRVEQAIRGVQAGQTLVIYEWAGLWSSGDRYRAGERLVLLLHRPSRLGMTSPVGGALGRFEVDANGQVVLEQAQIDALQSAPVSAPVKPGEPSRNIPGKTRISVGTLSRSLQLAGRD